MSALGSVMMASPNVSRFRWPPLTPLMYSLPTIVSAHSSSPSSFITNSTCTQPHVSHLFMFCVLFPDLFLVVEHQIRATKQRRVRAAYTRTHNTTRMTTNRHSKECTLVERELETFPDREQRHVRVHLTDQQP